MQYDPFFNNQFVPSNLYTGYVFMVLFTLQNLNGISYRTQVYLGSDLWVRMSVTLSKTFLRLD